MTFVRTPKTFADAMTRVAGLLDWEPCAKLVNRSTRCVRNWSEPKSAKRPTVDQALILDAAYQRAGGEGAPFFEAYDFMLDIRAAEQTACQRALSAEIATFAIESGEAIAFSMTVTHSNASPAAIQRAVAEVAHAHSASAAMLRRLTSFLRFGTGSHAGITGGTQK
jgi:hypothetical protein